MKALEKVFWLMIKLVNKALSHKIVLVVCFLLTFVSYSQSQDLIILDSLVSNRLIQDAYTHFQKIDTTKLTPALKAKYYHLYGKNLRLDDRASDSYKNLLRAKELYQQIDSLDAVAAVNINIVSLLNASKFEQIDYGLDYTPFLNDYIAYAESKNDPVLLTRAYMQVAKCFINEDTEKSLFYFKKSMRYSSEITDSLLVAAVNFNIGVLYSEHTPYKDSALYYYDKALKIYEKFGHRDYITYIYINRASVYDQLKQYDLAIANYLKADSLSTKANKKRNKEMFYGFMADTYEKKEDFKDALKYLKLHLVYKDSIDHDTKNAEIFKIQTKYEAAKKEKENLKLKQNRFWLIMLLIIATLLSLITYIAYRNQRNKKKVFEKEKEIQSERIQKLLKEQELSSLDAMVEGQEKERQRIASDLHDNLGSSLATLKLHFNNLKVKRDRLKEEEEALFEKTDKLIDETYQKVRNMAHAKHAGIKANESLLPAVKNFASKVSVANRLVIEVIDNNMDVRLDNALEMTIFRIIQELITNIIKHAKATEANVHLTHYGYALNILVEDNGIGFYESKIMQKNGMGLDSVKKRVEALNGKLTIESIPEKGTSIIIDIPL